MSKKLDPFGLHECEELRSRISALTAELATERAAREKAESDLALFKSQQWWADLDSARRERDTALARVKELEAHGRAEVQEHDETTAQLRAAESALGAVQKQVDVSNENLTREVQRLTAELASVKQQGLDGIRAVEEAAQAEVARLAAILTGVILR